MNPGKSQANTGASTDYAFSTIEFHEASGTFRTEFDSETRSASEAVIQALATARSVDPLELPPLFWTIDPEALDDLYNSQSAGTRPSDVQSKFELAGCDVTVHGHGTVIVDPQQDFSEN